MEYKREAQNATAFLDAVRTAIDGAEIGALMCWDRPNTGVTLRLATCQMEVAKRNLEWAIEELRRITAAYEQERADVARAYGLASGRDVVPAKEVGRDSISEGTACPG